MGKYKKIQNASNSWEESENPEIGHKKLRQNEPFHKKE